MFLAGRLGTRLSFSDVKTDPQLQVPRRQIIVLLLFSRILPCQELTPLFKSKDRPSLPTDMKVTSETGKIEL